MRAEWLGIVLVAAMAFGCSWTTEGGTDGGTGAPCIGGIFRGDYRVSSSAGIESLAGCAEVTGYLTISGTELTDLHGLEGLKRIGGDLFITAYSLESLEGLSGLETIGGDLKIELTGLKVADGLNALKNVGGCFFMALCLNCGQDISMCGGNHELTLIEGFKSLQSVGGDMYIAGNYSLERIDGFGSLTDIGGSLVLKSNPVLSEVKGFEKLVSVDSIYAVGVPLLTDIPSLFDAARAVEKAETESLASPAELEALCLNVAAKCTEYSDEYFTLCYRSASIDCSRYSADIERLCLNGTVDCSRYTVDLRLYLDSGNYPGIPGCEHGVGLWDSPPGSVTTSESGFTFGSNENWEDYFGDITGYVEGYKVELRDGCVYYWDTYSAMGIQTGLYGELANVTMVHDPGDELETYLNLKRTYWELEAPEQ